MKKYPKISETEWDIMKVIWASQTSISASDIIEKLQAEDDWHPKTAKTLLGRLVKKGALTFKKDGRAYLYKPLVKETECVRIESESFLDRFFGGALKPMLAHFVEHKKLSAADMRELKRVLEERNRK